MNNTVSKDILLASDSVLKDTISTQVNATDSFSATITTCNQGEETFYWFVGLLIIVCLIFIFIRRKRFKSRIVVEQSIASAMKHEVEGEMPKVILNPQSNPSVFIPTICNTNVSFPAVIPSSLMPINNPFILVKEEIRQEEQINIKHIGYNPINLFAQTEPLNYPYVIMPKPGCVIKFPRKGRLGRKGYKEAEFKIYIQKYFESTFQLYDDRFILAKNDVRYEPDFSLIDEKDGANIFLDIEIDEPYEGTNDISNRKAAHYQYSDVNRNNGFKCRGWIVIRFAEIQVHQNPKACCRFIADVLKSICPKINISEHLASVSKMIPVRQWTKEEAIRWSVEKYREQYLGIDYFGITGDGIASENISSTELETQIEKEVTDEKEVDVSPFSTAFDAKSTAIYAAINSGEYVTFMYQNHKMIVKPIRSTEIRLTAFCYVKNKECVFTISEMSDIRLKNSYYTLRLLSPVLGVDKVADIVNIAISNQKYIRMKYTRAAWTNMNISPDTGEIIVDRIEAEESIRTINDIQLDIEGWGSNYIKAYCNKREEQRTFRFDRISEIEILDI